MALVAGCANVPGFGGEPYPVQQLSGVSADYRTGYDHGCRTGYAAAGNPYYHFIKSNAAYNSNRDYAQGWDDGMPFCRERYKSNT